MQVLEAEEPLSGSSIAEVSELKVDSLMQIVEAGEKLSENSIKQSPRYGCTDGQTEKRMNMGEIRGIFNPGTNNHAI